MSLIFDVRRIIEKPHFVCINYLTMLYVSENCCSFKHNHICIYIYMYILIITNAHP